MRSFLSIAVIALAALGSSNAFAPTPVKASSKTVMEMSKNSEGNNGVKGMAAAAIAAGCIMSSLFAVDAAFAEPISPSFGESSSITIAGRSGGRSGGRAASGGYRPSSSSSYSRPSGGTTVIRKTVVQPGPSVIVAPPPMMGGGYGYGYGGPSFGTIATFGVLDAIGDGMREGRQNAEIRNTRSELEQERMKAFELEQRLKMIEMQQMQQAGQRPMIIQQAPPAAVAQ